MLYFLSKTDTSIIRHCPQNAKNVQASFGFFVLMTGIMAFFSGSYAISNMFIHIDPKTENPYMIKHGWTYSFLIGAIYACFIMAIDREIVAAQNKFSALIRIPLAIVIGLIVAVPVELQIFEGKIMKHLKIQHNNEKKDQFDKFDTVYKISELRTKVNDIEIRKQESIDSGTKWSGEMEAEVVGRVRPGRTGLAGRGEAYEEAQKNKNLHDSLVKVYSGDLAASKKELDSALALKDSSIAVESVNQSYDLLSKYIALKEVKAEDKTGSAKRIGFWLTVLFCLIEIVPSLMKLLSNQTEYDILLSRRTKLNIAATISIYSNASEEYRDIGMDELTAYNHEVVKKMYESQAY